ncbi:MAG: hypothetical protein N2445_09135, partial [Acidobacteria bacterium]|nr:hypothetical protein [Acidobacteriota bacterium]
MKIKSLIFWSIAFLSLALFSQDKNDWKSLEEKGLKISKIEIKVDDVFDFSKKEENHFLGKVANAVHIETKRSIIRGFLLFEEGDAVDSRIVYESERVLRELNWVRDAYI